MPHRSDAVVAAGVRMHLRRGGHGAPVLVLAPEFAPSQWFPYHDGLAAHFAVLAPDHPGFGQSELPEWLDGIDDVVLLYVDLLDQLGLERVSVVGTSLGGWIAAELAVAHPRRIDRLVLVGAAGVRVEGVERLDLFLRPFEDTLRCLFRDPTRAAQFLPAAAGAEAVVQAYRDASTLARLAWDPYLHDPKLARRLGRIAAPTLVVWGADDRVLPLPHGEAYARAIRGARLACVPDCGHLVPFEHPAVFCGLVVPFLAATS